MRKYLSLLPLFCGLFMPVSGVTITNIEPLGDPSTIDIPLATIDWCGDCEYLATAGRPYIIGNIGDEKLTIYKFDKNTEDLSQVASSNISASGFIDSISWRGDCEYIALEIYELYPESESSYIKIYNFNKADNSLTFVVQAFLPEFDRTISVDWCGDTEYLIVGGQTASTDGFIQVYSFVEDATLSLLLSATIPSVSVFKSVEWCGDDCSYFAAGGQNSDGTGLIQIYKFDTTGTATIRQAASATIPANSYFNSVSWCGDCSFVAAGGQDSSSRAIIDIYSFDKESEELSYVTSYTNPSESYVRSVAWCGDCKYLAASWVLSSTYYLTLYHFDQHDNVLSEQQTFTLVGEPYSVAWCGNCDYLAVDGLSSEETGFMQLFKTTQLSEPIQLRAQKNSHRFPTQLDIINTICWNASTDAVSYNVYADLDMTVLLAQITNAPYCYSQHQIIPGILKTYYVTAIDADGNESDPASVTI